MNNSETLPEGSTMTPSQVRKLKIAIAIMSVLLFAGFILLFVGIFFQTQKLGKSTEAETSSLVTSADAVQSIVNLTVPNGAELSQILAENGRLILHLSYSGKTEIAIIDLATGREVQRLRLTPQESP